MVATFTVHDSSGRPVAWRFCLPWEHQPGPLRGDPPFDTPEPFYRLLLCDQQPTETPLTYTMEEARMLRSICRVLNISRAHIRTAASSAAASLR
ncbi:hypothetical protein MRX96_049729 [Rhipicephalus microplus]